MALTVDKLKIGRKEYDVKPGDYIMFNGAVYQFVAGDKRELKRDGIDVQTALTLPKTLIKKIPFIRMGKLQFEKEGTEITKWYF
jgi:hypothetical protein